MSLRSPVAARAAALCIPFLAAPLALGELPDYRPAGSFSLGGLDAFDILPDGRLIGVRGSQVLVQDAVHASTYSVLGEVPEGFIPEWGAAFFRLSPDGTRAAIGDGDFGGVQEVGILDLGSLGSGSPALTRVAAVNYDAHWASDGALYVTGGLATESVVTRITGSGGSYAAQVVIDGISGASGGVTVRDGHLFTSDGFSYGGASPTGQIRAFELSQLGGAPLDFDTGGVIVGTLLSGGSLGFDAFGNLLVGGVPLFGAGFVAIVDAEAVFPIGGGEFSEGDFAAILSPEQDAFSHYVYFNAATGELLLRPFGSDTLYRYAIPAPGAGIGMGLALGFVAARRRR